MTDCVLPDLRSPAEVQEELDVAYAPETPGSKKPRRTLDIAWPTTPGPHPLIVFIHGGGWTSGHKDLFRNAMRRVAGLGYTTATVGYRLATSPRNVFPKGPSDVRCAIRYLRSKAPRYALDVDHVVAFGASAGGHLAALLGAAPNESGLDVDCPIAGRADVQGVVAWYPPIDLREPEKRYVRIMQKAVEEFLGDVAERVPKKAAMASPITHVDPSDAPMLLIHGTNDRIVPIEDSRAMKRALDLAGVPAMLIEIDTKDHGFPPFANSAKTKVASCTSLSFISAITKY